MKLYEELNAWRWNWISWCGLDPLCIVLWNIFTEDNVELNEKIKRNEEEKTDEKEVGMKGEVKGWDT